MNLYPLYPTYVVRRWWREVKETIRKVINFESGVEANMRGTNPDGRDDGDRSYVARTGSSGGPRRQCRDRGGVLRTAMITSVMLWVQADRTNAQVGRVGKGRPRRTKVTGVREVSVCPQVRAARKVGQTEGDQK